MVSQPKYWVYFIIDEQGRSLIVRNGLVTATAERVPLPQSPDGWQEIALIFQRDFTKGIGLNRSFTLPFGFVRDGATILKKTFYTENFERRLYLLIQQLTLEIDDTTFLWRYKFFTKQEFDFPKLKDTDFKVTVPLSQGGIQRLFDANKDTEYEIKFDQDSIIIKLDGLFLYQQFNWLVSENVASGVHLITAPFVDSDGAAAGFAEESQLPFQPDPNYLQSDKYLFTVTQDLSGLNFQGSFSFTSDADQPTFSIMLQTNTGRQIILVPGQPLTMNQRYSFDVDVTFDAFKGENFFLVGFFPVPQPYFIRYAETKFSIFLHSRYKATYCKAFKAIDLLKKLLAKMGIDPASCSSDLLESVAGVVVTCGNAIRGLDASAIKTSLGEFLEFCRTEHAAGYGIEHDKLVIEGFAHFLNTSVIKPLGEAKDLEVSYADDLLVNTIKVGYENAEIDGVNGKYAPNGTYLFSTPITKAVKEHNLVCPYQSEPYLIETLRLNLDGKTTTDNSNDNQTFLLNADLDNPISFHASGMTTDGSGERMYFTDAFDFYDAVQDRDTFALSGTQFNNKTFTIIGIAVLPDGRIVVSVLEPVASETVTTQLTFAIPVYPLYRPAFTSIEGVPVGADLFNISYLTPKEMLLRHLPYINSLMDGFAGQLLKYETTDKNAGLKTTFGGLVIEQKADVVIGAFKLFLTKQFDFENRVPVDLVEWMDDNPNSAFSVVDNGVTYILFYRNMGIAPNTQKEQSFKMLLAPNNNFIARL